MKYKKYHNSIYIGGTGVSGTANTFAFQSTVTANTRNYRNINTIERCNCSYKS